MLIKLSGSYYIAADQVTEVKINDYGTYITVCTKRGGCYTHAAPYGGGIYVELERLVAEINEVMKEKK
jgi:hypothetical protein